MTEEYIDKLVHRCRKYKLQGWPVVQEYTVTGLAAIYNGAGPDSWNPMFRSMTTKAIKLFEPAVLIHDVQFSRADGTQAGFDEAIRCWVANCAAVLTAEYPLLSWKMLNPLYRQQRVGWYIAMQVANAGISSQLALQAWQAAATKDKAKTNR